MKISYFLLKIILLLVVLFFLGSSISVADTIVKSTEKESDEVSTKENKPVELSGDISELDIIGIWVNSEYNNDGRSAKVEYIADSDGTITYFAYDNDDGSGNVYKGTVKYLEMWTDSEGRLCGKSIVTLSMGMSWETLDRISADVLTLEVQSGTDKIDPNGPRYSIYYRQ